MADIISSLGDAGSSRLTLTELLSALHDLAVGQHVECAVEEAARRLADHARGRQWTAADADEILVKICDAAGVLRDILGGLQTSYVVTDDERTLDRCAVLSGALSLVQDAASWIRLSAGLEAPDAPDGDHVMSLADLGFPHDHDDA